MENYYGFYVNLYVKVKVKGEMSVEEAIDKFEQECDYNIIGTDDIVVMETEYLETKLNS